MRQKEQNKPTERKEVNINTEKENKQSEIIQREKMQERQFDKGTEAEKRISRKK